MAAEGYKTTLLDDQNNKSSPMHEVLKISEPSSSSPMKQVKPNTLLIVKHFLHDCLIDCYKKTCDFENLKIWVENIDEIIKDETTTKNGTNFERFYHHSNKKSDINFIKSIQDIIDNKTTKYRSRSDKMQMGGDSFLPLEPSIGMKDFNVYSPFSNIQYIDTSILEAKISYIQNDYDEHCKKTLASLCDWAQIRNTDGFELKTWSCYHVLDKVKNVLMKNCVLINVGKNLENNPCVFHMNENNTIEIDLHFKLLLEKWGVRNYGFELSKILKEIKETYVTNKESIRSVVEKCSETVSVLMRENLRCGNNELSQESMILIYVCRYLLNDLNQIENMKFKVEEKFSSDMLLSIGFWKKLLNEEDVNLSVVKSARKEGNYNVSKRALLWYFDNDNTDKSLVAISNDLIENFNRDLRQEEGELCLQVAKLLYRYDVERCFYFHRKETF